MEAAGDTTCILDLEVVVEERCSAEAAALYPTNAVRNRSLRLVDTEALLLLDVDFVPSASLATRMDNEEYRKAALNMLQEPVGLVLPAFEPTHADAAGTRLALQVAHAGKEALLWRCGMRQIQPFHQGHHSAGHASTDFEYWAKADTAYGIDFRPGFEPYLLIRRKHVPWHDERLRGYFVNKVLHRAHMGSLGMRWAVHPGGFVVHLPHQTAASKTMASSLGLQERYNTLFAKALGAMKRGRYLPYVADAQLYYTSPLLGT